MRTAAASWRGSSVRDQHGPEDAYDQGPGPRHSGGTGPCPNVLGGRVDVSSSGTHVQLLLGLYVANCGDSSNSRVLAHNGQSWGESSSSGKADIMRINLCSNFYTSLK